MNLNELCNLYFEDQCKDCPMLDYCNEYVPPGISLIEHTKASKSKE